MTGAYQHQMRRDTSTHISQHTGQAGEMNFDTVYKRALIHDGKQLGGSAIALANLQKIASFSQGDISAGTVGNVAALGIWFSSVSVAITLPDVSKYPSGQKFAIFDGLGQAASSPFSINTFSSLQFINSTAGTSTTFAFGVQYQMKFLWRMGNSTSNWMMR